MKLALREMHVTLDDAVTDCIADLIILEARANRIQNDFHLKRGDGYSVGVWRPSYRLASLHATSF